MRLPTLLLALGLLASLYPLNAEAKSRFSGQASWRKNPTKKLSRKVTAVLTSDNCTGAAQSLSDGTAITWTRATTATCTKNDGTLTQVSSGQPRCNSSGCLVEPAATNVVFQSQTFENAYWTKTRSTLTADQTTAPDTTITADLYTLSASAGAHGLDGTAWSATCAAGTGVWTSSVYVKAGTVTFVRLSRVGNWQYVIYDLTSTGSVVAVSPDNSGGGTQPSRTSPTGSIASVVNGWFRISAQFKCELSNTDLVEIQIASSSATLNTQNPSFTPAGTETIYVWGAQADVGSLVATSYIPTLGTAVARNADTPSFNRPAWLTDSKGCVGASVTPAYSALPGSNVYLLGLGSATQAAAYDGTNIATQTITTVIGRTAALTGTWTGATMSVGEGVSVGSSAYDGAFGGSTVFLGNASSGGGQPGAYISNVKLGSTPTACP